MDRTWTLHWLQAAGSLAPWRPRIRAEIDAAFTAFAAVMPPPRVDIVIHQIKHWPVTELGFGGSAPSRNTMFLGFDTAHPGIDTRLIGGLRRVVVHEAHHCLRQGGPGYGATLGEALVSEGLADHFVIEALGGEPDPWCVALDDGQLEEAAALTEPVLRDESTSIQTWFHRGGRRLLPWAGYSLGWRLVDAYMARNPQMRASGLVRVPAEAVLNVGWPALRGHDRHEHPRLSLA